MIIIKYTNIILLVHLVGKSHYLTLS